MSNSNETLSTAGLSAETLEAIQTKLFPALIEDGKLYDSFVQDPESVLSEFKISLPQNLSLNPIVPEEGVYNLMMPYKDTTKLLEELNEELSGFASMSGEPYVQVEAKWWGVVFILSDKAVQDIIAGGGALAGVLAAIAAVMAAIPAVQTLAAVPGLLAGIIAVAAGVLAIINRGNGIYITALWPVVHLPTSWIPTPR
ncbi:MAG: hypothetical protein Roseis2KO_03740 [Roseivirga sp.]